MQDYYLTLDIHGHPRRNPPTPFSFKVWDEYDARLEVYWLGFMSKGKPNDYTEYVTAITNYWRILGKNKQFIQRKLQKLKDDGIRF